MVPVLQRFAPDIILVSAGFDAHARDPLAGMSLVEEDYANMVRTLLSVQPRLALILEGGYHLEALAQSVLSTLRVLIAAHATPGSPELAATHSPPLMEEVRHLATTLQGLHHLRLD